MLRLQEMIAAVDQRVLVLAERVAQLEQVNSDTQRRPFWARWIDSRAYLLESPALKPFETYLGANRRRRKPSPSCLEANGGSPSIADGQLAASTGLTTPPVF